MRFHFNPFKPFILAPYWKLVINFHLHLQLPPCIFPPRIWLCLLFFLWLFLVWPFLCEGLTQSCSSPLGIPQVWSNVGRGSSSANWSGMYQPKGKKKRRWRWAFLASHGNSASLFFYLYIPFLTSLCFLCKSHPSTKHKVSIPFVRILSFLPATLPPPLP